MLIPLARNWGYASATSWELVLSTRMAFEGAAARNPMSSCTERGSCVESASFVERSS